MNVSSYRSVKTEFKKSSIDGSGRFAKEALKKGEIIAVRSGHIINGVQLKEYEEAINGAEHQIADDLYLAPLSRVEFDQVMCYINHSCIPNAGLLGNIIIVAMRDINEGEEICLDYACVFSNEKAFECRCGSESCRRIVTGKDWMKKELQEKYGTYFSSYLLEKIREI